MNAQLKVAVSPNAGEKERADLGRIVKILKQANYRGYIVLEYEEKEDPRTHIPKVLDEIREHIAS